MKSVLLVLMLAIRDGDHYYCGDVYIKEGADYVCGDSTFTQKEYIIAHGPRCCGPVHCVIENDGTGNCTGGELCKDVDLTWVCGDILLSNYQYCQCGGKTLNQAKYDAQAWCCPGTETCEYSDVGGEYLRGGGNCSTGAVVYGLDVSCENQCRSREELACATVGQSVKIQDIWYGGGQCVDKQDICHGYPACMDESDILQCRENRDLFDHDYELTNCLVTPSGHQEFYWLGAKNDRQYDCLSRSDEDSLVADKTTIDYDLIVPCNTSDGSGFKCGEHCVRTQLWCNPRHEAFSCGVFNTQDIMLCSNHSYWRTVECDLVQSGSLKRYGKRCSGRFQHCYYPPYLSFNYNDNSDGSRIYSADCFDQSDKIYPAGCNDQIQQFERDDTEYCNKFCPEGHQTVTDYFDYDYSYYIFDQYGWNFTEYIYTYDIPYNNYHGDNYFTDNKTGKLVLKGTRCLLMCSDSKNFTQDCTQNCTGMHKCSIGGKEHCIHQDLWCDGHPHCDDAEDEQLDDDCISKLVKKLKTINNAATQKCISFMYSSKYNRLYNS